jgi:hypothetical protein
MRPPLEFLRVLGACVSAGSFARAAERLFVTPAAVSLRIRTLEAELDQPLWRRGSSAHGFASRHANSDDPNRTSRRNTAGTHSL